jgi:hypothetical protein
MARYTWHISKFHILSKVGTQIFFCPQLTNPQILVGPQIENPQIAKIYGPIIANPPTATYAEGPQI